MPIDLNALKKKLNISANQEKQEPEQTTAPSQEKPTSKFAIDLNKLKNDIQNKVSTIDNSAQNQAIINKALNNTKQDEKERLKSIASENPDLKRLAAILNSDENANNAEYGPLLEKAFRLIYKRHLDEYNYQVKVLSIKKDRIKQQLKQTINKDKKEQLISDYVQTLNQLYNAYVLWDDVLENQLPEDISHLNSIKAKAGLDTSDTLADVAEWKLDKEEENLPELKQLPALRKKYGHLIKYDYGD